MLLTVGRKAGTWVLPISILIQMVYLVGGKTKHIDNKDNVSDIERDDNYGDNYVGVDNDNDSDNDGDDTKVRIIMLNIVMVMPVTPINDFKHSCIRVRFKITYSSLFILYSVGQFIHIYIHTYCRVFRYHSSPPPPFFPHIWGFREEKGGRGQKKPQMTIQNKIYGLKQIVYLLHISQMAQIAIIIYNFFFFKQ